MSDNTARTRALQKLDALISASHQKQSRKGEYLLVSAVKSPPWDARPEDWAADWCDGWHYTPSFSHAAALGLELSRRVRTAYVLDEHGKKLVERNEQGAPILDGKGKPQYKSIKHHYFVWTQSSNFCFAAGYTIHCTQSLPGTRWDEQVRSNPRALCILDARPADAGSKAGARDSGMVQFQTYEASADRTTLHPISVHTVTQDQFIKILIAGLPK